MGTPALARLTSRKSRTDSGHPSGAPSPRLARPASACSEAATWLGLGLGLGLGSGLGLLRVRVRARVRVRVRVRVT